jgi:hypothetical protein
MLHGMLHLYHGIFLSPGECHVRISCIYEGAAALIRERDGAAVPVQPRSGLGKHDKHCVLPPKTRECLERIAQQESAHSALDTFLSTVMKLAMPAAAADNRAASEGQISSLSNHQM